MDRKTKIYAVFFTPGYDPQYLYYKRSIKKPDGTRVPKALLSNEDLLNRLKKECSEVEFIVREEPTPWSAQGVIDEITREIARQRDVLDGVLIFGTGGARALAPTGLPTIVVQNLFTLEWAPYESLMEKGKKVLISYLDRENVTSPSTNSAMVSDLVEKIKLVKAMVKMREAKMLYVKSLSGWGDSYSASNWTEYCNKVKETLGTEFVVRDMKELSGLYEKTDEGEAKKIAKRWIDESDGVIDTSEEEITESARLYLSLDAMVKKYNASAVTFTQMAFKNQKGRDIHGALPIMEFAKRGIIGCYQAYFDTILTQMLGYYVTGKASFHGDNIFDPINNTTTLVHCGCPVNAWGEKNLPYRIRDYTPGKWSEELQRREGAVPAVELPVDVPVTVWQIFPPLKKIFVYTGKSISGDSLYKGYKDILCRDKLLIKVDNVEEIMRYWNIQKYGPHRNVNFGDLRDKIRQIGVLLDFEVVEIGS